MDSESKTSHGWKGTFSTRYKTRRARNAIRWSLFWWLPLLTLPYLLSDDPKITCNKSVLYQKAIDCEKPFVDYFASKDATKDHCR